MHARAFERFYTVNAVWIGVAALFIPLWVVYSFDAKHATLGGNASEATVGIAVILRTTVRRFMRSASSNFMRTTFAALGRASARAATRRFVKAASHLVVGSLLHRESKAGRDDEAGEAGAQSTVVAILVGVLALALSFWGILQVLPEDTVTSVLSGGTIGPWTAAFLAGLPMLVYVVIHWICGKLFDVKIHYRTELDGLLLQGYFTGAGSFLPMTTDVDYDGTLRGKCLVATSALLSMLAIHVGLVFLGDSMQSPELQFLGAIFLVYAFIYVFPIDPLEGKFIWAQSRWLWLLVATPMMVAFIYLLPAEFGNIL